METPFAAIFYALYDENSENITWELVMDVLVVLGEVVAEEMVVIVSVDVTLLVHWTP